MDKGYIENKVNELFTQINYVDKKDEIDIISIAKSLGFAIGNAVLNDEDDGFLIVQNGAEDILGIKTDKLIGINSTRPIEWKRFIIAHEIAHYALHYKDENRNGMFAHRDHRKGKNEKENEADFFAANLLMPREKFTIKFTELKEKELDKEEIILLLMKKFQATQKMVERRIEELELNVA